MKKIDRIILITNKALNILVKVIKIYEMLNK